MARDTLTLMRHAKSDWKHENLSDHERPLNARGQRDAPEMARRLKNFNALPQLILCSTALRTRETADYLLKVFETSEIGIQYSEDLYLASPGNLLESLEDIPDAVNHVMIIAHNPGIEYLSAVLSGMQADKMPTAAIRQFTCPRIADIPAAVKQTTQSIEKEHDIRLHYSDYPKRNSENPAPSENV